MYKNATHAFLDLLDALMQRGNTRVVRGEETRELRSLLASIQFPTDRVSVIPGRKGNIFGTIAEAIWVVAGRNDVSFLERYLKRAPEYSDDGIVWRAAYGPRLRDWHGIDQVKEVVGILRNDLNSRRAALSLFDPVLDYIASKDIPCNNWLHFMVRDGRMHLSAAIRSSDIIWGFSGINTFEWSILQEMMAYWTGTQVGEFSYFISSLHVYHHHYERARKIIASRKDKTLYDFGFSSARFETPLEELDEVLEQWFGMEDKIRIGAVRYQDTYTICDGLLRNCLQMLWIYNQHLAHRGKKEIAELVVELPSNDFKVAAIDYFTRVWEDRDSIQLTDKESTFFEYLWSERPSSESLETQAQSFERVFRILSELHYKKTLVYKDSWKRQGEVVGVFCNIARKFDRIEAIVDGAKPTSDESLIDTIADLAVYSAKYLTYLAANYQQAFEAFIGEYPPVQSIEVYADNLNGFDAVTPALIKRYVTSSPGWQDVGLQQCYEIIEQNYNALKDILTQNLSNTESRKCTLAADLAIGAVHYIVLLSEQEPERFYSFANNVQRL